jgi:hypothetical protein
VWKRPYLLYHKLRSLEQQRNIHELEKSIQKSIVNVLRDMVPIEEIHAQLEFELREVEHNNYETSNQRPNRKEQLTEAADQSASSSTSDPDESDDNDNNSQHEEDEKDDESDKSEMENENDDEGDESEIEEEYYDDENKSEIHYENNDESENESEIEGEDENEDEHFDDIKPKNIEGETLEDKSTSTESQYSNEIDNTNVLVDVKNVTINEPFFTRQIRKSLDVEEDGNATTSVLATPVASMKGKGKGKGTTDESKMQHMKTINIERRRLIATQRRQKKAPTVLDGHFF